MHIMDLVGLLDLDREWEDLVHETLMAVAKVVIADQDLISEIKVAFNGLEVTNVVEIKVAVAIVVALCKLVAILDPGAMVIINSGLLVNPVYPLEGIGRLWLNLTYKNLVNLPVCNLLKVKL
jgi:hypothetical protein